jgi:L-ascorbate oxidase
MYPPLDVNKPLTLPNTTLGFLDYALKPYPSSYDNDNDSDSAMPPASAVTRTIFMTVHQSVIGPTIWRQNGLPWTESFPREPYLISLYKNDSGGFPSLPRALENDGLDNVTRTFPADIGEVLEIVIQNTGADSGGLDVHPFHAHGAHYWDLGSGNGTYNQAENELRMKNQGATPVKRDTTMLYRYATSTKNGTVMGWRAWRLKVTQPGAWMIHCHILQHMLMGMQSVWVMGNSNQVLGLAVDVQGYLDYGGSVVGNQSYSPQVVHFKDGDDY